MQPPSDLHGLQTREVSNTIFTQTPVVFKALDDLGGVGFGEVFGRPRSHPTCHWVAISYSWVIKTGCHHHVLTRHQIGS